MASSGGPTAHKGISCISPSELSGRSWQKRRGREWNRE
jgi:hypothetical protein